MTETRQCIVCRERAPKHKFARIHVFAGEIKLDRRLRGGGRGAYVHLQTSCVAKLAEKKRLERALRISTSSSFGESIRCLQEELVSLVIKRLVGNEECHD